MSEPTEAEGSSSSQVNDASPLTSKVTDFIKSASSQIDEKLAIVETEASRLQSLIGEAKKGLESVRQQSAETASIQAEYSPIADELKAIKKKAESRLSAFEEAQKEADKFAWEAGEARKRASDDASTTERHRKDAESGLESIQKAAQQTHELAGQAKDNAASIQKAKTTSETTLAAIAEIKTSIDGQAGSIASAQEATVSRTKQVEKALVSAETNRDKIEKLLTAATESGNQISTVLQATSQHQKEAAAYAEQAAQSKQASADAASASSAQLKTVEAHVKKLSESVGRSEEYEAGLRELTSRFESLHVKIEGLLPGAASVGLASAFEGHTGRLTKPKWVWAAGFVISLIALIGFAIFVSGDPIFTSENPSWEQVGVYAVRRLLIALPLVWLAIYAGRQHMLMQRVEEDYAFKAATSRSFEGYKREMNEISGDSGDSRALITLCMNVLQVMGSPPGRIYDGKHEDVTPLAVLGDKVERAISALRGDGATRAVRAKETSRSGDDGE